MHTKLGLLCDKLIEAGWLVAAVVAPLFFNFYSYRSFEPDKVTLVRSIALVMATAWLIKALESGLQSTTKRGEHRPSGVKRLLSKNPLAIPALILAGTYILTTITSVVPMISFWGAYHRPGGTYTILSYITIFFVMCHSLRTRQQLERLITTILLTSLPVSLYGILQHYDLDPLPWAVAGAARVRCTIGNPIFVGGYLIMVVPLTLYQLFDSLLAFLHSGGKGGSASLLMGCYTLLLAAQLICILFTQSRGPFLGLMAAVFFFVVLLAVSERKRGLALTVIEVSVILMLFLILFNLPNSPLASLRDVPYIGRLGRIFGTGAFPGRMLIWQGAIEMVTADPWRTLLGYGPDSMFVAYNKFYPSKLIHYELGKRPDRCHNQTFDALVTTGLIGFAAYIFLFTSIFYYGLKGLGLIRNRLQRALLASLWFVGGASGALLPRLLEGTWRLAGVGLPLGFVAAIAVYLIIYIFQGRKGASPRLEISGSVGHRLLLVALLSALIAHFIEIQSGLAVATTSTYFWVYAALLAIVGYSLREESVPKTAPIPQVAAPSRRPRRRRKKRRQLTSPSNLRGISRPWAFSTLPYSLLVGFILITMGFDFIHHRFNVNVKNISVLGLMAVVWLFSGAAIAAQTSGRNREAFSFPAYFLVSSGWFFLFIIIYLGTIHPGADVGNTILVYYLFLFLTMVAIAAALAREVALPSLLWQRPTWWLYPILGLVVIVVVFATNLNIVKADIYYKVGLARQKAGRYDESIAWYRRALELAPHQDRYYLFVGLDSMAKMQEASNPEQRSYWFEESRKAIEKAMEINPLDPDYPANLGTLYLRWAGMAADPAAQAKRLEKSLEYYQQAAVMSPHHHGVRLEGDLLQIHLLLGAAYTAIGQFEQAAVIYQKASEIAPDDYVCHKNLALLYQRLGRMDEAIAEAKLAKELAPVQEKKKLEALLAQLESRKP